MRSDCIEEVQKAIGRQISKAEARGIEDRVVASMTRLARKDPDAWRRMPKAERARQAADLTAKDMVKAADLKERRLALQMEAVVRYEGQVNKAGARGFSVINRILDQIDRKVKGAQAQAFTEIADVIDFAVRNDQGSIGQRAIRYLSQMETPENTLAFAREVWGVDSGNAMAKAAAKQWIKSIEGMRQRFNEAGGDIRRLAYGYMPQPHDDARIRKAGLARWVTDTLPKLDRTKYVTPDGRMMSDTELGQVLEQSWRTIESAGWDKIEPGQFRGEGSLANAGSQARVIHFKDPESYIEYLSAYGSGTVYSAMQGHVHGLAKNIALVEEMGPSPATTFRTLHDIATKNGGVDRTAVIMSTEDKFKVLNGELTRPAEADIRQIHQSLRDIQVFGKLGGAFLSSISDIGNYALTLQYHKLPFFKGMETLVRSFGPDAKHFARVAGAMVDSQIAEMHLYGQHNVVNGLTGVLADRTMKLSLLNAWTEGTKRAMSLSYMAAIARMHTVPWEQLDQYDRARLETSGWTGDEWALLAQAKPVEWQGGQYLTRQSLQEMEGVPVNTRERLISRLLGAAVDESEYASVTPNLSGRTLASMGLQSGTHKGELLRHAFLFKGTPLAQIFRHWDRALNGDMSPGQRTKYIGTLMIAPVILGALAIQLKDMVQGKDPRPMDNVKFWEAAVLQGGGAGFIGDVLLNGQGRHGQSASSAVVGGLIGPVYGSGFELGYDVFVENVREAAEGKDTDVGAEAFRWVRGHLPFLSLWYSRLVLDRAILDQMQEFLSPGYSERVKRRAEKEWGSSYWWDRTGEDFELPDRGPSLQGVTGEFSTN